MIEVIDGLPPKVAAFKATGTITENDYINIINPLCEKIYCEFGKINYLLVINTPLKNYKQAHGLKMRYLALYILPTGERLPLFPKRKSINDFTNFFGKLIPGKPRAL